MALMKHAARFSEKMRARRFERFKALMERLPRPLNIIDIGGTTEFWEACGCAGNPDYRITLVNLFEAEKKHDNITSVAGDATNMPEYGDLEFDIAFSNSVIEHVFTYENQQKMAAEVERLSKNYWVQTPNFWFPMEPHFHFIGWQWMPVSWRIGLLRRRRCGWRGKTTDPVKAREIVEEVRLMSGREMRRCFPSARLDRERFLGLTKSWIMIKGFE